MGQSEDAILPIAETSGDGRIQSFLQDQAKKNHVWLVGGTIPLKSEQPDKCYAACLVYDDQGSLKARYNKIHLFDVQVADNHGHYTESKHILPGKEIVVVDTPFGRLGLAICYDLRFPELFRALSQQGAELIAVGAAFTAVTGRAHWHVLLRARAIENLCYVIGSAQGGRHENQRETYGHSVIIDPWGAILDELPSGNGIIAASLDRTKQAFIREQFPALSHRRL
jgi:nitrilase